ncbi:fructose 1,6-bisphosphatase [Maribacter algarum]|uniref:Fructose 1,6-bisphosphatase n=1 Tax=Maribacter algarum (ex Zhang et al. 2020) TaxID=2578118 RepID=A0A5S3PVY9_9FLAO|nr:fructose 1,6-bisphosphatase [Maribacter algarum]TMM59068.1 fructose 1,6-bisphosphatase [Maribacter algarum]
MTKNNKPMFKLEDKIESSASKIDLIKNLIFGETIQAYDKEFDALKKDILQKKKVLEDLVEEIRADLNTTMDSVSTDLNIRITELEKNLENKIEDIGEEVVNRKVLGKLLVELGEKIGSK